MVNRDWRCEIRDRDFLHFKVTNGLIRYAYGTAFWSIKAQIGTRRQIQAEPKASACIGDKYRSEPLSTKKQCLMHFIVRPPTCLTDN